MDAMRFFSLFSVFSPVQSFRLLNERSVQSGSRLGAGCRTDLTEREQFALENPVRATDY
jgi:hypothetical protein